MISSSSRRAENSVRPRNRPTNDTAMSPGTNDATDAAGRRPTILGSASPESVVVTLLLAQFNSSRAGRRKLSVTYASVNGSIVLTSANAATSSVAVFIVM